jgi:hypothetical protein
VGCCPEACTLTACMRSKCAALNTEKWDACEAYRTASGRVSRPMYSPYMMASMLPATYTAVQQAGVGHCQGDASACTICKPDLAPQCA